VEEVGGQIRPVHVGKKGQNGEYVGILKSKTLHGKEHRGLLEKTGGNAKGETLQGAKVVKQKWVA